MTTTPVTAGTAAVGIGSSFVGGGGGGASSGVLGVVVVEVAVSARTAPRGLVPALADGGRCAFFSQQLFVLIRELFQPRLTFVSGRQVYGEYA